MLRTRQLADIKLIPSEWVFENYLILPERLTGQNLMIKSAFNPSDRRPSMSIYFSGKDKCYRFKDFSTDKGGGMLDLVMMLFNEDFPAAVSRIENDYELFVTLGGDPYRKVEEHPRYSVTDWVTRQWNERDKQYWTQFGIGSRMLEHYRVFPLECYTMQRLGDDLSRFVVCRDYIYGFFKRDSSLYKIYQPKSEQRFIKTQNYIQGSEQLRFEKPYLVITKAIKDICCISEMKLPIELIAPDSESTLIKPQVINAYRNKYKAVCTLFDNDKAGIRAMERYKKEYDLPCVHFTLAKDVSDSVKDNGMKRTRDELIILLRRILMPSL